LVQATATAFLAAPQRSTTEINLFDEIMDKVLAEVEPLARRELAERLAELTAAAHAGSRLVAPRRRS
jgi:uncharacterized protein (DUF2336 family)